MADLQLKQIDPTLKWALKMAAAQCEMTLTAYCVSVLTAAIKKGSK